jgi:SAM-dependent methyltransferase
MTADLGPAMPADLRYDLAWLHRYEQLSETDACILDAEIKCVDRWFDEVEGRTWSGRSTFRHLDLGTCTGRYLRWSQARKFAVSCGIDASIDAVRLCRRLARPGRVIVEQANFLAPNVLPTIGREHGPFDLITLMMGTINHVASRDQTALLLDLAHTLTPAGRILVSAWRPTVRTFSLYSANEWAFLAARPLASSLLSGNVLQLGLQLHARMRTRWHDIFDLGLARAFKPAADESAELGLGFQLS